MKLENPIDVLLRGGSIYRALEVKAMKGLMGFRFRRLLDVGCGGNHYLRAEEYHTVDINPKSNPTLCFDANFDWVGAVDGYYDCVFSANCLEHLTNPENVFKESARVLADDGLLILAVPFMYPYHSTQNNDFFRFTPDILRHWANKHGLDEHKVVTFGERFSYVASVINLSTPIVIRGLISLPLACVAAVLDEFAPKRFYLGTLAIYNKPKKKTEVKNNVAPTIEI